MLFPSKQSFDQVCSEAGMTKILLLERLRMGREEMKVAA
jgi:hypothetical protein